jgi:hypothetical protein
MRATFLLSAAVVLLPVHLLPTHTGDPLKPLDTVELRGIQGPILHMAVDVKGQRIFVAATSKNTVEIFDAVKLRHINSIPGLAQPADLVFEPETGNLLVSNGADGSLRTYDASTLKLLSSKLLGGDADRIHLAPGGKTVLVGWGVGGLAVIDRQTGQRSDIRLKSHPESVQIDVPSNRIFVNLPGIHEIEVIDRRSQTLTDSWSVKACHEDGAMALDSPNRRIFLVCRRPAKLFVLNMDDGSVITSMATVEDGGDVLYEGARKRVYVVGGDGYVASYKQKTADEYLSLARVEATPGAAAGLLVPEWNRFFIIARDRLPVFQAEMLSFTVED